MDPLFTVIDKKKPPKVDLEYFADEVKQFGRFIFFEDFPQPPPSFDPNNVVVLILVSLAATRCFKDGKIVQFESCSQRRF